MATRLNGVRALLLLIVAAITLGTVLTANSQLIKRVFAPVDYVSDVFYRQEGTIIAQGRNTTPIPYAREPLLYGRGPTRSAGENTLLISYRIERVTFSPPLAWDEVPSSVTRPIGYDLRQRTGTFDKVWRLTVTGGPFRRIDSMGSALPTYWSIWLDDAPVGRGAETYDGMMTLMFDPTPLREGAAIGVSGPGKTSYFPEKVHLVSPP